MVVFYFPFTKKKNKKKLLAKVSRALAFQYQPAATLYATRHNAFVNCYFIKNHPISSTLHLHIIFPALSLLYTEHLLLFFLLPSFSFSFEVSHSLRWKAQITNAAVGFKQPVEKNTFSETKFSKALYVFL